MAFDLKKCFNGALLPAAIIVVLSLIGNITSNFLLPPQSAPGTAADLAADSATICMVGLIYWVVMAVVFGWAGFRAVKQGMDILGGAVTGTIAAIIASFVYAILSIGISEAVTSSDLPIAGLMIMLAFGFAFQVVIGAVCALIGAFIATKK